jgi:hypothetical protein
MALFFAFLGGLFGAIVGAVIVPAAAYAIFQALGASTREGALAMGGKVEMYARSPERTVVLFIKQAWYYFRLTLPETPKPSDTYSAWARVTRIIRSRAGAGTRPGPGGSVRPALPSRHSHRPVVSWGNS